MVRLWRVCRGQSTWHEEREVLGTWEDSYGSSRRYKTQKMLAGLSNQTRRMTISQKDFGLTHSTERSGKAATWGRG